MDEGDIIEFSTGDDRLIGAITRDFGDGKFEIQSLDGKSRRTSTDDITFHSEANLNGSSDSIERGLNRFRDKITDYEEEFSPELAWEFVDSGTYETSELAELYFDQTDSVIELAIERRILREQIYFTQTNKGLKPRPESKVEQLKHQRKIERQRRQRREKFVKWVADQFDGPETETNPDDEVIQHYLQALRDYALEGADSGHRKEAEDIIDIIEDDFGAFKGKNEQRAFGLLVELRIWGPHKNLVLERSDYSREPDDEITTRAEKIASKSIDFESNRTDLTDWMTFSVDDESTKDIDDALSIRDREDGWELAIHIADPDVWADPGSKLDKHARHKGSSIYLPTGNIPMFPRVLSRSKMSLNDGDVSPAVTTIFDVDLEGRIELSDIELSIVEVDRAIPYDSVNEVLESDRPPEDEFERAFDILKEIAVSRRQKRRENGATTINIPDTEIQISEEAISICAKGDSSDKVGARDIIEECMILNNEALGRYCKNNDLPIIYRNQKPPNESLDSPQIQAYPEGIARKFQKVYRFNPGVLSTNPDKHFGLGIEGYAQASSPIRRYPDLICQRQVKSFIRSGEPAYDEDEILQLLGELQNSINDVQHIQRETEHYWILVYLEQNTGETFEATVLDLNNAEGTHADIFIDSIAFKTSCRFPEGISIGSRVDVLIQSVDPRKDYLSVEAQTVLSEEESQ